MMSSQIDKNDLTVYPEGINNYDQVNEFEMYENHEDEADQNHNRAMQGLRKLREISQKIHIMIYNADSTEDKSAPAPIRELKKTEKVYNFSFDYAFSDLSKDDQLWLEYYIRKYRFVKIDDKRTDQPWNTRVITSQMRLGLYIDQNDLKHIRGIWS